MAALVVAGVRPAWAQCEAMLEGKVIDVQSFEPLPGAWISAPEQVKAGRTDVDGHYVIEGLCPGDLLVEVGKDGYQTHRERFSVRRGDNRHDFYLISGDVDTVEAEASRLLEDERAAQASELLTGRELDQTRGLDLARSLGDLPGVRVLGSGATAKPVINGLNSNRISLIYDGVAHANQDWGLDHAPEIDPFAAGSIRVVKGAAGVRYGPDALGGVVLVEPRAYAEKPALSGDLNLVGLTNGWGGAASGAVLTTLPGDWDRLSLRLEGTYRRQGDLTTPDYVLDNTAQEERALRAGVRWRWGGGKVEASYSHYANDYGIFFGVVSDGPQQFFDQLESETPSGLETFRYGWDINRPYSTVRHDVAQLRSRIHLSKTTDLLLTYAFQANDRREFDQGRERDRNRAQAIFLLDTHTLDAVIESRIDDVELEYGVAGQLQFNDFGGLPFIADYTKVGGAGFFIARYLASRWELELGARADYEYYDTVRPGRTNVAPDVREELDFFAFTTTGGLIYDLGGGWTLRGQLATAARNPSPDELFADGPTVGTASLIIGDTGLDTETTMNAQVSVGFETDRAGASLSGYGHYISDYIFLAPQLGSDGRLRVARTIRGAFPVFAYQQVDAGFVGFDGDARVRLVPWLELKTTISLVRARDLENDRFLVYVPPDAVRTRLTVDRPRWGALRAPYLYAESEAVLQQTRFDLASDFAEPPESYHLVHMGAGCRFDLHGQALFVDVEIRNVGNESYRDYLSRLRYFADEPGISGFVRLSLPFDEALLHEAN